MESIGKLCEVWRYPVKSMRGELVESVFVGFSGLEGDRFYSVVNNAGKPEFPWFTAREQEPLLLYTPKFTDTARTAQPGNLATTQAAAPGINPMYPEEETFAVQVTSPGGESFEIRDPAFIAHLESLTSESLRIQFSQKGQMDSRPLSLLSTQTVKGLSKELDMDIDRRRFRANLYIEWNNDDAFFEDSLIGRTVLLGDQVELKIIERDSRCKMITIDPDTAETTPQILKHVTRKHGGYTGVYGAVLKEGVVNVGDTISLM